MVAMYLVTDAESDKIFAHAFKHLHIFVDPNPADSIASFNDASGYLTTALSWSDKLWI